MLTLYFLPAAREEVSEAYGWYEKEAKGLGNRFSDQLDRLLARISSDPLQFPVTTKDIRRARLARFPYSLYFRIAEREIYILAYFHTSRDPVIWQRRV